MEHYNACIRPDGTWIRQYLLPGRRPGHIQSNTANTLVVGDCGYLGPDDGRRQLHLADEARERPGFRPPSVPPQARRHPAQPRTSRYSVWTTDG